MYKFDNYPEVEIKIPDYIDVVLINLSGGVDSSLLFYLVCDEIKKSNRNVKIIARHFVDLKMAPKTENIVKQIVDRFKQHFIGLDINLLVLKHYQTNDNDNKVNYLRNNLFNIVEMADKKFMNFSATSANPPKQIQEELNILHLRDENRDVEVVKDSFYIMDRGKKLYDEVIPKKSILVSKPFNYVDKKFIAHFYKQNEFLKNNIFHLTSSCVSTDVQKNKFWSEPCKECWWCKEKHWAFGKYDYEKLD